MGRISDQSENSRLSFFFKKATNLLAPCSLPISSDCEKSKSNPGVYFYVMMLYRFDWLWD